MAQPVIEDDLDMIANAEHTIDMGPGGGASGGQTVAVGSPGAIVAPSESVTGRYLAAHGRFAPPAEKEIAG